MRIAHLNTEATWGGGEAQTLHLVRGLHWAGHRSVIFARRGSELARRADAAGLEIRALPSTRPTPSTLLHLFREIVADRFDLCHLHTAKAVTLAAAAVPPGNGIARIATRRLSLPLGRNWFGWKGLWRLLDHHIAVSDTVAARLRAAGIPACRISVIPSAIDLDRFRRSPDGAVFRAAVGAGTQFLFGAIGRLTRRKGADRFVEAAARLLQCGVRARFVVIGEGEEAGPIAARIARLGLTDRVALAGFRDDIPAILAGLDALVFPGADGEGSPAVVKEAMAAGVPVIAADHPSVREIADADSQVLLVPDGSPEALAGAMQRLVDDPALGRRLGAAGRDAAAPYSIEAMVKGTEAVYRRVTNGRNGSGPV